MKKMFAIQDKNLRFMIMLGIWYVLGLYLALPLMTISSHFTPASVSDFGTDYPTPFEGVLLFIYIPAIILVPIILFAFICFEIFTMLTKKVISPFLCARIAVYVLMSLGVIFIVHSNSFDLLYSLSIFSNPWQLHNHIADFISSYLNGAYPEESGWKPEGTW